MEHAPPTDQTEPESPSTLQLTDEQIRVLGALVEKCRATPEHYPLSLNALKNACNQKSSRDPVVEYDEATVERAVNELRDNRLAGASHTAGSRVIKFRQTIKDTLDLNDAEVSLLGVLMLRGPQTVGELRNRTGRLFSFPRISDVEEVLHNLGSRPAPLVRKLPLDPGFKESRYTHLLGGSSPAPRTPRIDAGPKAPLSAPLPPQNTSLQDEVATLRRELDELRNAFDDFRKQFE